MSVANSKRVNIINHIIFIFTIGHYKKINQSTNIYRKEVHEGLKREYTILTLDTKVWHVLEYDHEVIDTTSHGQFHNGDTYVVRWHYMITQSGKKIMIQYFQKVCFSS